MAIDPRLLMYSPKANAEISGPMSGWENYKSDLAEQKRRRAEDILGMLETALKYQTDAEKYRRERPVKDVEAEQELAAAERNLGYTRGPEFMPEAQREVEKTRASTRGPVDPRMPYYDVGKPTPQELIPADPRARAAMLEGKGTSDVVDKPRTPTAADVQRGAQFIASAMPDLDISYSKGKFKSGEIKEEQLNSVASAMMSDVMAIQSRAKSMGVVVPSEQEIMQQLWPKYQAMFQKADTPWYRPFGIGTEDYQVNPALSGQLPVAQQVPQTASPVEVTTREEIEALPSGTQFIYNGQVHTRK